MKRFIFTILALLVTSSVWAATKVQVMTDGKIDVDRLPTISFFQESDPASPELGQIWWNNSTAQLKVAGALGVYAFNATSLVEWDTTPEAFSFTDITNATTSTRYGFEPFTVSGINWPTAISVSGDASAEYSVNNATAVSTNGTVVNGDVVQPFVTSSASDATAVNATVTIGGVSHTGSVTTAASESVTYLVDEDFEGTGTPSGWVVLSGTPDFDCTATVLSGSESASFLNATAYYPVAGDTTQYFAFEVQINGSVAYSTTVVQVGFYINETYLGVCQITTDRIIRARAAGTASAASAIVLPIGQKYYIKGKYTISSGANDGEIALWYSTDGVSWTSAVTISTGTNMMTPNRLAISHPWADTPIVIDNAQAARTDVW